MKFVRQSDGTYRSGDVYCHSFYPTTTPALTWYEIKKIGRRWIVFYCGPGLQSSWNDDGYPTLAEAKDAINGVLAEKRARHMLET